MTKVDYGKQVFQVGDRAINAFDGSPAIIRMCFVDCDPHSYLGWHYTHCVVADYGPDFGGVACHGQGDFDPVPS